MKINVCAWYPSTIATLVARECEFDSLEMCVNYLHRFGLNVLIPKDFKSTRIVYVDEKMFTQR